MKLSYLVYDAVPDLAAITARMETIAALGYDGIELTATHPLGYAIDNLAAASRRLQLPVVSLLTGWSYVHEGLCLSSPDSVIRERTVARLIDYVGWAERLGALVVVGLLQGLRSDEPDGAVAQARIAAALAVVANEAAARGVMLVLEPINHLQVGFHHTAAEVQTLIDRIGSPAVGLMLDTIHMNIEESSPLETIERHGRQLGHFHLCESNGGPFGSGNLDFAAILTALEKSGYERYVSVKVYRQIDWETGARGALQFLRAVRAH